MKKYGTITIDDLKPADARTADQIASSCGDYRMSRDEWKKVGHRKDGLIGYYARLDVEEDNATGPVVGVLCCQQGEPGQIGVVFVHPDYREQGVGTALVRHALGTSLKRSREIIVSVPARDVFRFSGDLLRKFGFRLERLHHSGGRDGLQSMLYKLTRT